MQLVVCDMAVSGRRWTVKYRGDLNPEIKAGARWSLLTGQLRPAVPVAPAAHMTTTPCAANVARMPPGLLLLWTQRATIPNGSHLWPWANTDADLLPIRRFPSSNQTGIGINGGVRSGVTQSRTRTPRKCHT